MKRKVSFKLLAKPEWMSEGFANKLVKWRLKALHKRFYAVFWLGGWKHWRVPENRFNPSVILPLVILITAILMGSLTWKYILPIIVLLVDAFHWQYLNKLYRLIYLECVIRITKWRAHLVYRLGIRYDVKVERIK